MDSADKNRYKTRLRGDQFAQRLRTQLWSESPSPDNPYIAEHCLCHGYDLAELVAKRSFVDVLYLLFRGELPEANQARILETLMIGLVNPGPRHPATRAAMNAGIGKTDSAHILPIAQLVLGGGHLGGKEAAASMRFLNQNYRADPVEIARALTETQQPPDSGDWHIAPGFGTRYGGIDLMSKKLAQTMARLPGAGKVLQWSLEFADVLEKDAGCSWLSTGLAASVLSDLGFHPRTGAGLFQLFSAPGLLAHGLEMSNKPLTAMPFIGDDHYVLEK